MISNIFINNCAVAIDDQIGIETIVGNKKQRSSIDKILDTLEKSGAWFIKRTEVPTSITGLSNVAYFILDWDIKSKEQQTLPGGVSIGESFRKSQIDTNKTFIKKVLSEYFIPIFIFSQEDINQIKSKLYNDNDIAKHLNKRVFIESKVNLKGKKINKYFSSWIKKDKTILTLKVFENSINVSKDKFLVEMGNLSTDWVSVVYKNMKQDYQDEILKGSSLSIMNQEFNEFLINALISRMVNPDYSKIKFKNRKIEINGDINKVFEAIKFYKFNSDPGNTQSFEGDLYQKFNNNNEPQNSYLININAPCDLRKEQQLFLSGKAKDNYKENQKAFYYVPLILGKKAIAFKYDDQFRYKKNSDMSSLSHEGYNYKRIGRLTHPYITALRSEFSHFISRQGIPRHPNK